MTFASHEGDQVMAQLPRWKCHKTVWAIEIQGIVFNHESGGADLIPIDGSGFGPFAVSADYFEKHRPQPNGYYVKYEDGYESWSPKDVFEAGYEPL